MKHLSYQNEALELSESELSHVVQERAEGPKAPTKNWYLPLNKYQDWLKKWILEGHKEWRTNVYGQCKSWLDMDLQPRAMTRDLDWGIPVPVEPEELVKLIHGRIINHHGMDVITASLKGVVSLAEIDMISQLRDELDMAEAHKEKCQARMLEICEREFPEELKRLQTIPGIKERAATSLIAEIGTDMNKFETANHLEDGLVHQ